MKQDTIEILSKLFLILTAHPVYMVCPWILRHVFNVFVLNKEAQYQFFMLEKRKDLIIPAFFMPNMLKIKMNFFNQQRNNVDRHCT